MKHHVHRLPTDRRSSVPVTGVREKLLLSLVAMLTWGAASPVPATELERHEQRIGERERSWAVVRPPETSPDSSILLVLHGSGGDADRIRAFTGRRFERLVEEHGVTVVYPEGFETNWNGCRAAAPFSANRLDVDDVAFLRAVVERTRGPAAAGRVFAFGFSGGGHLALRLALEAPDLVDAVAAVGASLPVADGNDCLLPSRLSDDVLLIDGTDDPINPYDGGEIVLPEALGGHSLGSVLSVEETAGFLARLAGHEVAPLRRVVPERDGDPGTALEWQSWLAPERPRISLVTVIGGGHTIPGPGVAFPEIAGKHTEEVDATEVAWRFFEHSETERE